MTMQSQARWSTDVVIRKPSNSFMTDHTESISTKSDCGGRSKRRPARSGLVRTDHPRHPRLGSRGPTVKQLGRDARAALAWFPTVWMISDRRNFFGKISLICKFNPDII